MANGKITKKTLNVENVVFTYANYGQWFASTQGQKRVLQGTHANYFVVGDGSTYCRILDFTSGTVQALDISNSPFTLQCITCDV